MTLITKRRNYRHSFFSFSKPFDELHETMRLEEKHALNYTRAILCFVNTRNEHNVKIYIVLKISINATRRSAVIKRISGINGFKDYWLSIIILLLWRRYRNTHTHTLNWIIGRKSRINHIIPLSRPIPQYT